MESVMPKRIGDVAKAAGVGVETVRFYERQGLVDRPLKPERGWREYDETALLQLGRVRLAQKMGLTLGDVKTLKARAKAPQKEFCTHVRETVNARLATIEKELATLEAKRVLLKRWLTQCQRRGEGADCPLYAQTNAMMKPKGKRR
jgi:MerR family mercuric resistance operon transcriptional regulator